MDAKERDEKIRNVLVRLMNDFVEYAEAKDVISTISEEYAKQKCIEQKEICSDAFSNIASARTDPDYPREYRAIRNAPLATDR